MSPWLPTGFRPPPEVVVPYGHRLRPEDAGDLRRLCVAVPGADTAAVARLLADREREMARRAACTYALVDVDETALLGEVRLAPDGDGGTCVTWWVVPECRDTDLGRALDALVPAWVAEAWPAWSRVVLRPPTTPPAAGPGPAVLALLRGEC